VNTINLTRFQEEKCSHDIKALNFKECEHISYKSNETKVMGSTFLKTRWKMIRALLKALKNPIHIARLAVEDEHRIINYV